MLSVSIAMVIVSVRVSLSRSPASIEYIYGVFAAAGVTPVSDRMVVYASTPSRPYIVIEFIFASV